MKRLSKKIVDYANLTAWRAALTESSTPLVVTNGCFDLLHPGHLYFLEEARDQGRALLVGVNTDDAIRTLKGDSRPILPQVDRLHFLAGLEAVSAVCLFPGLDAHEFIARSRPDVYVKGGTYSIDTINQAERQLLESLGVRVVLLGQFGKYSTTNLVNRCGSSKNFHDV